MVKGLMLTNPGKNRGPWKVLCDNESFPRACAAKAARRHARVELMKIPTKAPDLNPPELYWVSLCKQMRARLAGLGQEACRFGEVVLQSEDASRSCQQDTGVETSSLTHHGPLSKRCAVV